MSQRGLLRATLPNRCTVPSRAISRARIAGLLIAATILATVPAFAASPDRRAIKEGLTLRIVTCEGPVFLGSRGGSGHLLLNSLCYLRPEDQEALGLSQGLEFQLRQQPQALEFDLRLRSTEADGTWSREGQDLGQYRLAEGETLVLEDLEAFGIEPVSLKAISPQPADLVPTRLVNLTQSIEGSVVQEGWTWVELSLHNSSNKTVDHLEVIQRSAPPPGRGVSRMFPNPSLPPGEKARYRLRVERRLLADEGDFAPDSRIPAVLEISSVVFRDGSSEGAEPVHSVLHRTP